MYTLDRKKPVVFIHLNRTDVVFSMSKRNVAESEIVGEAVSELTDNIKRKPDNDLFEPLLWKRDCVHGRLAIDSTSGITWIDITRGLKKLQQRECDNEKPMNKYTIMLFIFKSVMNTAVQFIEIESQLKRFEILKLLFRHLKCDPHTSEKITKCGIKKWGHLHRDEDHDVLYLVEHLIEVYVAKSDGKSYRNDFTGAMSFIHRALEEPGGEQCPLM